MKRPNIVIFNPDQFRADALGHLGNRAAHTPVLDGLVAREAVSFRNAFCQNPVCTPSRCSFMSGWYPHVRGHRTMHHMMRDGEPVLLRTLKDSGYFVWWGGKNDLVPGQAQAPFDAYCDIKYPARDARIAPNPHRADGWRGSPDSPSYYSFYAGAEPGGEDGDSYNSDRHYITGACEFIKEYDKERPFCVYLPLESPHPPYYCEQKWIDKIDRAKLQPRIPAPDFGKKPAILKGIYERQRLQGLGQSDWDDIRQTYLAMCARIDSQLGMIIDVLKKAGAYDDTVIFFISDHGDFTGDYGLVEKTQNTFEDCLVNVPFVVKPPRWVGVRPRVSGALIENIDMCATIEELTEIAPAHTHFGKSLVPLLGNECNAFRDAVFCEGGRLKGEAHCSERESADQVTPSGLYWPRVGLQLLDDPPYHSKAVMIRTESYKYVRRLYETDELYDLAADPMELNNVINDEKYRDVLASLKDRLCGFYLETSDVVPFAADSR